MTEPFIKSLARNLSGCEDGGEIDTESYIEALRLVRKVDTDLRKRGDFVLPSPENHKAWKLCSKKSGAGLGRLKSDYISLQLMWPIQSVEINGPTMTLRLDRSVVMRSVISRIVESGVAPPELSPKRAATFRVTNHELERECSTQLSKLRTIQVTGVIKRLLTHCGHQLVDSTNSEGPSPSVIVGVGCSDLTHILAKHQKCVDRGEKVVPLQVGPVLDGHTKKMNDMNFGDIYGQFYKGLSAVARERDGPNVNPKSIHISAAAEFQFQLLAKTINLPITLNPDQCDKASFVLYNNARIVQIFGSFYSNSTSGEACPLPSLGDIDFSLLKEEEEWELIFNGILPYLDLIDGICRGEVGTAAFSSINRMTSILTVIANVFSKYYRRVRVLKKPDSQPEVLKTMYARLHLLLALRVVNQHAFDILGIQALKQM